MQMITPYRRYRRPSALGFPFETMFKREMGAFDSASVMKTDIQKTDEGFELSVELPGFSKDDIELELKDGYVIVSAQMKNESSSEPEVQDKSKESETPKAEGDAEVKAEHSEAQEESNSPKQTWVRRERFFGSCTRSFYMGEDVDEEGIKAKFENGLLHVSIPKKEQLPEPEQKKLVEIEG